MTLVWTVENQDAVGKWFRVTPKLFENRFDAIEWCSKPNEFVILDSGSQAPSPQPVGR